MWYIVIFIVGGLLGVTLMAMFQVGKAADDEAPRCPYDFQPCDGITALQDALTAINCNGYQLIGITQHEHTYTVFFRRHLRE